MAPGQAGSATEVPVLGLAACSWHFFSGLGLVRDIREWIASLSGERPLGHLDLQLERKGNGRYNLVLDGGNPVLTDDQSGPTLRLLRQVAPSVSHQNPARVEHFRSVDGVVGGANICGLRRARAPNADVGHIFYCLPADGIATLAISEYVKAEIRGEWCEHTFNPWVGCQRCAPVPDLHRPDIGGAPEGRLLETLRLVVCPPMVLP